MKDLAHFPTGNTHRGAASSVLGWHPIETAPRDGTEILAYCPGLSEWQRCLHGHIIIVRWQAGGCLGAVGWFSDSASEMEGYESTGDYVVHVPVHPTHWMPLPDRPTTPGEKEP